jgi:hypothetical protein
VLDLYKTKIGEALLGKPFFFQALKVTGLSLLLLLLFVGWQNDTIPGVNDATAATDAFPLIYTNATTLVFWVIWFMGLVLLAPLLGRLWCGFCPLGFVSEALGRVGLNKKWPNKFLRGFLPVTLFILGVVAVIFFAVHKSPHLTALTVGGSLLLAIVSGLIWQRSAFCGFLCPVGLTLSLYGRLSPLRVGVKDATLCSACKDKGCQKRESSWKRWDLPSMVIHKKVYTTTCPVALDPPTMEGADCLFCLNCVRGCKNKNMGVLWGGRERAKSLSTPALFLLTFLVGLLSLALVRTWPWLGDFLTPGAFSTPLALGLWLGLTLPALIIFGGAIFWFLEGALSGTKDVPPLKGDAPNTIKKRVNLIFFGAAKVLATPFVGLVLGGHMALALVKLNAKIAYFPYLFLDPFGKDSYLAMHVAKSLHVPDMLLPLGVIGPLGLMLLGGGVYIGLWQLVGVWRLSKEDGFSGAGAKVFTTFSFSLLALYYFALLYHWLMVGR